MGSKSHWVEDISIRAHTGSTSQWLTRLKCTPTIKCAVNSLDVAMHQLCDHGFDRMLFQWSKFVVVLGGGGGGGRCRREIFNVHSFSTDHLNLSLKTLIN